MPMISFLSGTVQAIDEKSLTLLTGGVGYEVLMPINTLFSLKIGEQKDIHIHTHVREDQITLFGFLHLDDKSLFRKLITISGVGPKSALSILSISTPQMIIRYIETGKADLFPKVPGVGKKTVEKIILELKGTFDAGASLQNESEAMQSAALALETLGYASRDISEVLHSLDPSLDMSSMIREALKVLSKVR